MSEMTMFDGLRAEFPRDKIHWRAQSLTKDGNKAMALAYLDARDVMDRLDSVCGPDGWQTEHYDCGGKMGCKIGIRSPDVHIHPETNEVTYQWIWKSDGAGETQVEADKGAFSGALKRAAVMWGIGRYLYNMPTIWVPCDSYKKGDKFYWKGWNVNPWDLVKNFNHEDGVEDYGLVTAIKAEIKTLIEHLKAARSTEEVMTLKAQYEFTPKGGRSLMDRAKHFPATQSWHDRVCEVFAEMGAKTATTGAG